MNFRPVIFYIIYIALASLAAFIAYGLDKKKSVKGRWRISEKTLLGLGIIGGAAGGILGMKTFHHKTKHWYFWAINIISLIIHIALLCAMIIFIC